MATSINSDIEKGSKNVDLDNSAGSFVPAGNGSPDAIKSIVVLNNSRDLPRLLEGLLEEEGYEVDILHAAEDAHRRVTNRNPSLVILDMVLENPNNTWQLLQILKLDPNTKDIPVVVCSADSAYHEEHIAQLDLSGCYILHKPFDPNDLRNLVQETLDETGY